MKELTKDTIIWPDLYVHQKKDGYRFSMDSIILARLVKSRRTDSIVEIGSGSGVILFIIARLNAFKKSVGIEIQKDLHLISKRNMELNKQTRRIQLIKDDIKNISKKINTKFDIVLSNPPYYPKGSGRLNKNLEELIARHEIKLDLESLVKSAKYLLTPKGQFCIIYLASRCQEVMSCMRNYKIEPKLLIPIYPNANSEADLVWIRGVHSAKGGLKILPPLICYNTAGKPSKHIQAFYSRLNGDLENIYPSIFKRK